MAKARCRAADLDAFVPKPLEVDRLASVLGRWLSAEPERF